MPNTHSLFFVIQFLVVYSHKINFAVSLLQLGKLDYNIKSPCYSFYMIFPLFI